MEREWRTPADAEIARFFQRIFAALIDGFLLLLIFLFGVVPFFGWFAPESLIVQALVNFAYFTVFNSKLGGGATLGKHVMGIRVVDRSGEYISLARAALRAGFDVLPSLLGVYIPMAMPWTVWPIAEVGAAISTGFALANLYLYVFNYQTRQVLHDLVARTFVVKADTADNAFVGRTGIPHILFAIVVIAVSGFVGTRVRLFHEAVDGPALCERPVTEAVRTLPFVARAFVNRKPFTLVRYSDPDHTTVMAYVEDGMPYQQARLIAHKAIAACPAMQGERSVRVLLLPQPSSYSLKPRMFIIGDTVNGWRDARLSRTIPGQSMRREDGCTENILHAVKKLSYAERVEVNNWIAQRPQGPTHLKQIAFHTSSVERAQKAQARDVARLTLQACPAMNDGDQLEVIVYPTGTARPARTAQVFGDSVKNWRSKTAE